MDVVSNYIWRGADLGGFSIQPSISKDLGPIEVGVWSSYTLDGTSAGAELDLYVSVDWFI